MSGTGFHTGDRTLVVPPGTEVEGFPTEGWAIHLWNGLDSVIDSGAAGRPALFAWLTQIRHSLESLCEAEHANALHLDNPEPGCPACARDAAEDAEDSEQAVQVHIVQLENLDGLYLFQHEDQADEFAACRGVTTDRGTTPLLDRARADELLAEQDCPACGEEGGPCELAPCGDPGCDARDCQNHDTCERATS